MLEKKNEVLSEEDEDYLKQGEEIKGEVQTKKPRSEAQIKAFEKTREKRRLKLLERAKAKQQAELPKTKPKKTAATPIPFVKPEEEDDDSSEGEIITRKIYKKKKKPKKKVIEEIIYQSATESESEDETLLLETNIPTHQHANNASRQFEKFVWA